MKPSISAVLGPLLALLLSGCGDDLTAPGGDPDYVGYIVQISQTYTFVRALDDPCGVVAILGPETYYGVSGRAARLADLRAGLLASLWVSGSITDSCPRQAAARAITVD